MEECTTQQVMTPKTDVYGGRQLALTPLDAISWLIPLTVLDDWEQVDSEQESPLLIFFNPKTEAYLHIAKFEDIEGTEFYEVLLER